MENIGNIEQTPKNGKNEKNVVREGKQDRAMQIMEIKMKRAEDSSSIVFIPVGGIKGQEVGKNLLALNKHVRMLKSSAVFGDIANIKKQLEEVERVKEEMWDKIKTVIPRFSSFPPKRWSEINNSIEEKIRLAQRRISYVITPVDDTMGGIIMATKILSEKIMESQASSSLDELSNLIETYRLFNDKVTAILNDGRKNNADMNAKETKEVATQEAADVQKVPELLETGIKGKKK